MFVKYILAHDTHACAPRTSARACDTPPQSIESQYKSASGKTNALHNGCEELVREQSDLVAFNESISTRLGYFVELATLSQKMNSPTLSVMNDQFIPMLSRIDECIAHISAHPE